MILVEYLWDILLYKPYYQEFIKGMPEAPGFFWGES